MDWQARIAKAAVLVTAKYGMPGLKYAVAADVGWSGGEGGDRGGVRGLEGLSRLRRALPLGASGIARALEAVAEERIRSVTDKAWTMEEEARDLESLPERETFHVGVDEAEGIAGFQSLGLWSTLTSMAHSGQVGTHLLREWHRKRGWPPIVERYARPMGYSILIASALL